MRFDELGLAPELLRAVSEEGYTDPTPIQAQAIPIVLAGKRRVSHEHPSLAEPSARLILQGHLMASVVNVLRGASVRAD